MKEGFEGAAADAVAEGLTAHLDVRAFVTESNRIEGVYRPPTAAEIREHEEFLSLERVTVDNLIRFVGVIAPGKLIRDRVGMNVRVGNHYPPPGHPGIASDLDLILDEIHDGLSPYGAHHRYETLHPFMDGNGRSGRVLWLWQMVNQVQDPYVLSRGFLHTFYYQALSHGAGRSSALNGCGASAAASKKDTSHDR